MTDKTHCKHGHAWIPENLIPGRGGYPRCRLCHEESRLRYRQSEKGKATAKAYRQTEKNRIYEERFVPYHQRYNRSRRRELQERLQALKLEKGCVDCGYDAHPAALDFDHVAGEKVAGLSQLVSASASWERIEAELAKCDVRCANCHRIITVRRRRGEV